MSEQHTFKPGDGVHWQIGSDCCAGTVVSVGRTIIVSRDRAVRVDKNGAYSDEQDYLFVPDENGEPHRFTRRRDGRYLLKGCNFGTLRHGRSAYRDPCF